MKNLRSYVKDKVSPGYSRVSVPLRIAENYIERNLKFEHNDFSEKYSKKLGTLMNQQQIEELKDQYTNKSASALSRQKYSSEDKYGSSRFGGSKRKLVEAPRRNL